MSEREPGVESSHPVSRSHWKTLDLLTDDFASESALGSRLPAGFIRSNLGDAAGLEQRVGQQVKLFVDSVR